MTGRTLLISSVMFCGIVGCAGTPRLGDVTLDADAGGAAGVGGATAMGGTQTGGASGTGGSATCDTLVTTLDCVTDDDCCVVASARCELPLWLVTASERAALGSCLTGSHDRCSSCMGTKVQVACQDGQCVGTSMGMDTTWPPSGLSAPHCGKLPVGTGGASAIAPTTTGGSGATSTAPANGDTAFSVIKFGCG
jgi:hypothetical protein